MYMYPSLITKSLAGGRMWHGGVGCGVCCPSIYLLIYLSIDVSICWCHMACIHRESAVSIYWCIYLLIYLSVGDSFTHMACIHRESAVSIYWCIYLLMYLSVDDSFTRMACIHRESAVSYTMSHARPTSAFAFHTRLLCVSSYLMVYLCFRSSSLMVYLAYRWHACVAWHTWMLLS